MPRKKNFVEDVVVEKTMRIFWEKGYNAASINDLVEGVKINRASMYASFTDKHTLFIRTLQYYYNYQTVPFIEIINQEGSAKEVMNKVFDFVVSRNFDSGDPKGCFMVNTTVELALQDAAIAEIVNNNKKDIETAFASLFKKAITNKEIPQIHTPENLAQYFYAVVSGLQTIVRNGVSKEQIRSIAQVAMNVL